MTSTTSKKPAATKAAAKTTPAKKSAPAKKPAAAKKSTPAKASAVKKAPTLVRLPAQPTVAPPSSAGGMVLREVRYQDLYPAGDNLRGTLTDVSELAQSIAQVGILEPLTVVDANPAGNRDIGYGAGERWVIVAGHRRHAAVGLLLADGRWPKDRPLPCVSTAADGEFTSDADRVVMMLVENLQRVDLNPVEEARGYQRLIDAGWKQKRIAEAVGRDENRVSLRKQLLKLPAGWLTEVESGAMHLGVAQAYAALPIEVIAHLAALPHRPTPGYALDAACRDYTRALAIEEVNKFTAHHDLEYSKQSRWELERKHQQATTTTVAGLPSVLVPEGCTHVSIEIPTQGGLEAKATIVLWATPPAAADKGPDDDDPAEQWRKECERIDREHRVALHGYGTRRAEFARQYAPTLTGKDVGAAAILYLRDEDGEEAQLAKDLGWVEPAGVDEDTIEASLAAWWAIPKNLVAGIGLHLLEVWSPPKMLLDPYLAALTTTIGPEPAKPAYPPHPDRPTSDSAGDQAADEDDGEYVPDDGDDNPYCVEPDDSTETDSAVPGPDDDVDGDGFGVDA
ncbi:MAG: ParB N-terminal domain-containing protein [Actinomycetota bacterium]|nr:ParB N-terminal domain-containing protein [Actinomycetota bacterium]